MTEIPEDVRQAARAMLDTIDLMEVYVDDDDLESVVIDGRVNVIELARVAIMAENERFMNDFERAAEAGIDAAIDAERERCIKIAKKHSGESGSSDPFDHGMDAASLAIVADIKSGVQP